MRGRFVDAFCSNVPTIQRTLVSINSVDSTQIEGKMFEFKDFGTIQRKLESISTKVSAMIPPGPYIPFSGFYPAKTLSYCRMPTARIG